MVFASGRVIKVVSLYLQRHFPGQSWGRKLHGLCHGAKVGEEVRLLRASLRQSQSFPNGVYVLGTDISHEAAEASHGDVFAWDFHVMQESWYEAWDFIYSNTLDHAYHPGAALLIWRRCLRTSESLLVLQRSPLHSVMNLDATDVFGGSLGDYCSLLRLAGFEIIDVVRLPQSPGSELEEDLIFAIRGSTPQLGEVEKLGKKNQRRSALADAFEKAQGQLNQLR